MPNFHVNLCLCFKSIATSTRHVYWPKLPALYGFKPNWHDSAHPSHSLSGLERTRSPLLRSIGALCVTLSESQRKLCNNFSGMGGHGCLHKSSFAYPRCAYFLCHARWYDGTNMSRGGVHGGFRTRVYSTGNSPQRPVHTNRVRNFGVEISRSPIRRGLFLVRVIGHTYRGASLFFALVAFV